MTNAKPSRWIALAAVLALAASARAGGEAPASGVEVGKPAPAIRLNDHTGVARRVGPGSEKRWVVLAFFPKAMTPGCTVEVCSLRDAAADLEPLGATVYGASLDDVATQARFAKEQALNFALLSDPDGSAAAKYGVLVEGKGYASRVTFFVDPDGVLRHVDRSVKPDTHGRDVVETLRRLRG